MRKAFFAFILSFGFGLQLLGQHSIQSIVFDSDNGMAIEMATIRLLNQKDSALVQGTQTDMKGGFILSKVKNGNYILLVSSVGYIEQKKNITVASRDLILKNIQLVENVKLLKEVEVKGTAAQLVVKGDTVEYNAAAFKTTENAAVEELLKKLPGVEITAEGKIMVNGEEIKKIRVDGKKFFDGDIEQATKNLPADLIDKIQVLEQKSDMALLTGFEDGDTERIINLTTKPNRRTGIFGNVNAGTGIDRNNDIRYDAGGTINVMSKSAQTAINVGLNNLNNSRSSRGRGSWSDGASGGVSTLQNIGLNNNTIVNDKLKIGGNVTLNHTDNLSKTYSNRTSYLSETTYNDISERKSNSDMYDIHMSLEMEWKIDSLRTLILQPNMSYNSSESDNTRKYSYLTANDSTSWGDSNNSGNSTSVTGGLNVIYNRKSLIKKGRSFTSNLTFGFSQGDNNNYNLSNKYTPDSITRVNQFSDNKSDRFNASLRMSQVEPLWNLKNMIEIALRLSLNNTTSEKNQYGIDNLGNYSIFNQEYSNNFENRFYKETLELNYRYVDKIYNIMVGLNAEPSQTNNLRTYGNGYVRDTTYGVFNFAPTARFQFNFGKKKFARFDYRGRTQQPSINQMQPVKNNNDLMSETIGNPSLNPSFSNYMRLMYSTFNDVRFSSFSTYMSANLTKDAMVSNKIYDSSLKQYNQTINSGLMPFSLAWSIMYNTPIIQKRLHFNTNTNLGYRTQYSYISRGVNIGDIDYNNFIIGDMSKTRNYNSSEEISLTLTQDVIELGVRGRIGYTNSLNNLKNIETETWDWMGRGNVVIRFPYDFTLSSDIAYSNRAGYSNLDQSEIMWNASVDKAMFKKKAVLSLRATDILHQRLNIRQVIGDNYVQYSSYNTLPSYFLLTFTYKLSSFGAKDSTQSGERRQGMGDPGMRRGNYGGGGGGRGNY